MIEQTRSQAMNSNSRSPVGTQQILYIYQRLINGGLGWQYHGCGVAPSHCSDARYIYCYIREANILSTPSALPCTFGYERMSQGAFQVKYTAGSHGVIASVHLRGSLLFIVYNNIDTSLRKQLQSWRLQSTIMVRFIGSSESSHVLYSSLVALSLDDEVRLLSFLSYNHTDMSMQFKYVWVRKAQLLKFLRDNT